MPVIVTLYTPVDSQDLKLFEILGGNITYVYRNVTFGFAGWIPAGKLRDFARVEGANLVVVEADLPAEYHLDVSVPLIRARPIVWRDYGYNGSSSHSIAILDTGIDDSHLDLGPYGNLNFSRKIIGWYDATGDGATTPEDYGEYGSHVAGIAAGTGKAEALQGNGSGQFTLQSTVEIPGDANRDATVNADDLLLLNEAYGSTPDSANWNLQCDFNKNSKVNVSDLRILGKNYGRTG